MKIERLRKTSDFERVRQEGARMRGRYCSLSAARALSLTNEAPTRVGYITSRRVGGAVQRNRAKRLMRESVRLLATTISSSWDIVIIAHPSMTEHCASFRQVKDDIQWLLIQATIANTLSTSEKPTPPPDTASSASS
jgi:ribonuclease P protein component